MKTVTWLVSTAPVAFTAGLLLAHCSSSPSTSYSYDGGTDGPAFSVSHTGVSSTHASIPPTSTSGSHSVTSSAQTTSVESSSVSVTSDAGSSGTTGSQSSATSSESSASSKSTATGSKSTATGSKSSTNSTNSVSSASSTSASSGASSTCYAVATTLYPEDGGALYCPFSAGDGGKNISCPHGYECCETPASAGTSSTCETAGTTCPVSSSIAWTCEGTPDCASGSVCCGVGGTIKNQGPQPGCAADGGTSPASLWVSGTVTGTTCSTTCSTWQICSASGECSGGKTCVPLKVRGNDVGACCSGTPGAYTCD